MIILAVGLIVVLRFRMAYVKGIEGYHPTELKRVYIDGQEYFVQLMLTHSKKIEPFCAQIRGVKTYIKRDGKKIKVKGVSNLSIRIGHRDLVDSTEFVDFKRPNVYMYTEDLAGVEDEVVHFLRTYINNV